MVISLTNSTSTTDNFGLLQARMPIQIVAEEDTLVCNRPKKPPSAYVCFLTKMRPTVAAQNPQFKMTEITTVIASMWRNLNPPDRKLYQLMAESYKESWTCAMNAWRQQWAELDAKKAALQELHDQEFQAQALQFYKAHLVSQHTTGPLEIQQPRTSPFDSTQTKVKDTTTKPRRGRTSFLYFSRSRRPQLQQLHPSTPSRDISIKLGEEWRSITDSDKQRYVDMAELDTQRYLAEMREYQLEQERSAKVDAQERRAADAKRVEDAISLMVAKNTELLYTNSRSEKMTMKAPKSIMVSMTARPCEEEMIR